MQTKVLIIQRIFPHYRNFIFDELAKIVDLLVLHSRNESGIKQVTEYYSKEVKAFRYGKKETNVFLNVFNEIIKFKPDIIIHDTALGILSTPLVILLSKILRIKFLFWGHGYNMAKGFNPDKKFESNLRLFLMRRADGYIFYTNGVRTFFTKYLDSSRLFIAQNTLNTDQLLQIRNKLKNIPMHSLKDEIGYNSKYNLIYIGRMIKDKYPNILIDVYEILKKKYQIDLSIHFIGDGELVLKMKKLVESKKYQDNIKFYGSLYDDEIIGKYIFCSDLVVIPGYVGLTVNHAFCFECPVITFKQGVNGPFHSPEAEYIIDSQTGFFAKNFDSQDMARIIISYLKNTELQNIIKNNIREFVKAEIPKRKMLDGFLNAIYGR